MRLFSTTDPGITVSFCEAVDRGIAADGGLFMPASVPAFPPEFFRTIGSLSFQEISFLVAQRLLEQEIPDDALRGIVEESLTFPAPLLLLDDRVAVLELFHGPTLAFKDFGARFMARTLAYLHRHDRRETTILVATSGDTGSAVAHGFHNVEGMTVVLLYPSGRVSAIQELQLTTLEGNVTALEIEGTFDDCQRLVKQAFADSELSSRKKFTSANSINVGRLLPQAFYYFNAFARLPDRKLPPVFSVPSGNLGNLTAGLIAWKMGLPVGRFIAATNANDVLPRFLETGSYAPARAVATISNAMDVGNPSNFSRILALFDGSLPAIRGILSSASFSDDETRRAIREVFQRYGYVMDPHGAVAYGALRRFAPGAAAQCGIVLETAHPAKFPEVYDGAMKENLEVPDRLQALTRGTKRSVPLSGTFEDLKAFLLSS
jgi:threonine synthase